MKHIAQTAFGLLALLILAMVGAILVLLYKEYGWWVLFVIPVFSTSFFLGGRILKYIDKTIE